MALVLTCRRCLQSRTVTAVESAQPLFCGMERNGHKEHAALRKTILQFGDDLGQHTSQDIGGGANLPVLQQVDQLAQPAFIAAVSQGPDERWFDAPAQPAARCTACAGNSVGRD